MTKQPVAILTSDLHVMAKTPACRVDDFQATQREKWEFIKSLQEKYQVPILSGGDVFDVHNPPLWLVSWFMSLDLWMYTVAGQHDLPAHNMSNYYRSGLNCLEQGKSVFTLKQGQEEQLPDQYGDIVVHGFNWNEEPKPLTKKDPNKIYIALIHYMVYQGEPPFPNADKIGGNAKKLMKKLKGYDVIVSGDNHVPFIEKTENQLLINCGSVMRTTASQCDYKPAVWLLFTDELRVEPVYLPIKVESCVREHLKASEEREERISAFVEKLGGNFDVSLSFDDNVKKYLLENDIKDDVKEIVMEAVYG